MANDKQNQTRDQKQNQGVEKRSLFNEGIKKIIPQTSLQNKPTPPAKKD